MKVTFLSSLLVPLSVAIGGTKAQSENGGSGSAASINYQQYALYSHNLHRYNHSANPLTWDQNQANIAAYVAASCVFAHQMGLYGYNYGQNIASYGQSDMPQNLDTSYIIDRSVTWQWYNDELELFSNSWYGMATPPMSNFEKWGHMTQIIWKSTTAVGCASQYCRAGTIFSGFGSWFTVCNYVGAGNVEGSFGQNVGKPEGLYLDLVVGEGPGYYDEGVM